MSAPSEPTTAVCITFCGALYYTDCEAEEGVGLAVGVVEGAVELAELERGDEGLACGGVGEADAEGGRGGEHDGLAGDHLGVVVDDDGGPAGGPQVEVELREDVAAVEVAVQECGADEVAGAGADGERVAVLGAAAAARRRRGGHGGEVAHRRVLRALLRRHGDGGRLAEGEPSGVARPQQAQLVRVVCGAAAVDADET